MKKNIPENQKIVKNIGELIKEYRFSEGWTQQMLGDYCDLNRNTISRVENGKNISVLTLLEIAATLEINLVDLFSQ